MCVVFLDKFYLHRFLALIAFLCWCAVKHHTNKQTNPDNHHPSFKKLTIFENLNHQVAETVSQTVDDAAVNFPVQTTDALDRWKKTQEADVITDPYDVSRVEPVPVPVARC